jgi:hypothetical protein
MKKLLTVIILSAGMGSCAIPAQAQHFHHGYRGGYGWGWVAPAVIGGAVVYAATRPTVVVQQPPSVVYVPQPNQVVAPYAPPQGFHWEQILDANCNCYRLVLVQG